MKILFTAIFCFLVYFSNAQEVVKIYNPDADVATVISQSLIKAKAENKHLFLQIGGNWCSWCRKFHKLSAEDSDIKARMDKSYITILVNFSKENRNFATPGRAKNRRVELVEQ